MSREYDESDAGPVKQAVQVLIRIRGPKDVKMKAPFTFGDIKVVDETQLLIKGKTMRVSAVYPGGSTQEEIYENIRDEHIVTAMKGYKSSFVCAGNIATGKTYTLFGNVDEPGLAPRAIEDICTMAFSSQLPDNVERYIVEVSFIELSSATNKFSNLLLDKIKEDALKKEEREANATGDSKVSSMDAHGM